MPDEAIRPEWQGVGRLDWLEEMVPTGQMVIGDNGEQIPLVSPRWDRVAVRAVIIECFRALIEELHASRK